MLVQSETAPFQHRNAQSAGLRSPPHCPRPRSLAPHRWCPVRGANLRQIDAACRDTDPELFFPPSDDDTSVLVARHRIAIAPICGACPVATDCLRWALDTGQDHGLWAATTPTDRRAIRRARMAGVPDPVADDEPMCPACALLFPMPAVDGELCSRCAERNVA